MLKPLILFAALAALACAAPASAQLPGVGLPTLPQTANLGRVGDDLSGAVEDRVNSTRNDLRSVRQNSVSQLLARHRDTLEADGAGNPIVRHEIMAIAPNEAALAHARDLGFQILRRDEIDGVGALVVLQAPPSMATAAALAQLRQADPAGTYDFDHLNLPSGNASGAPAGAAHTSPGAPGGVRVGLIDGGVADHPSLTGAVAEQRAFNGDRVIATAHATAVASLLGGRGHGVAGAVPTAEIYVADIYGGQATGGTSAALARALGWLTSLGVPVINVSLVGPRNQVMEAIVASAVRRGFLIVAAVGNDGPAAAPLYPAAYAGVVGVTGVDARNHVLVEAERGPQVVFAALGVATAASLVGQGQVRGTSFAAPIVAGLLAARAHTIGDTAAALHTLEISARDLGAPGRDDIYGYGRVAGQGASGSR